MALGRKIGSMSAVIIAEREVDGGNHHVVLALDALGYQPYVTWIYDQKNDNAFWGHYYSDIVTAAHDFEERAGAKYR